MQINYLKLNITDGYLEFSRPRFSCQTFLNLPAYFQNRHIQIECALKVPLLHISGNPLHPAHEKITPHDITELFQNSLYDANVPQKILSSSQSAF